MTNVQHDIDTMFKANTQEQVEMNIKDPSGRAAGYVPLTELPGWNWRPIVENAVPTSEKNFVVVSAKNGIISPEISKEERATKFYICLPCVYKNRRITFNPPPKDQKGKVIGDATYTSCSRCDSAYNVATGEGVPPFSGRKNTQLTGLIDVAQNSAEGKHRWVCLVCAGKKYHQTQAEWTADFLYINDADAEECYACSVLYGDMGRVGKRAEGPNHAYYVL